MKTSTKILAVIAFLGIEIAIVAIVQAVHPWISPLTLALLVVVDVLLCLGFLFDLFPFLRPHD